MTRKSKKAILAERQDPAAPFHFDEQQLPLRQDVVELVRGENHRHTGQRLLENEKLCLRLVELLLGKWGLKKISRELNVSKWTVKAARGALVSRGEMAPCKERVVSTFNEIVEVGAASYLEDLEEGRVAPREKPVGLGIVFDKRALAVGEPTSIDLSARVVANPASLTVEKLRAFVRSLEAPPGEPKRIPAVAGREAEMPSETQFSGVEVVSEPASPPICPIEGASSPPDAVVIPANGPISTPDRGPDRAPERALDGDLDRGVARAGGPIQEEGAGGGSGGRDRGDDPTNPVQPKQSTKESS